jgi:peptidyl-tRNA hydrolase
LADTAYALVTSRSEFHTALRNALQEIATLGCRELFISDLDFADWPLSDTEVLASLTSWAHSHRKLTVLAQHFDEVVRCHARWVEWRQHWSHIVECRANTELEAGKLPTLLLAPGVLALRLVDPVRYRGSVSHEAADMVRCREALDAVLQRSVETFPVTTLGL